MSDYLDSNRGAVPPIGDNAQYSPQRLAGVGAVEDSNSRPFAKDRMHMLSVGVVPIRVLFGSTAGTGTDVSATGGVVLAAGTLFPFRAGIKALYLYIEAADGVATYESSVWQRET